jgi:hypothetical protein
MTEELTMPKKMKHNRNKLHLRAGRRVRNRARFQLSTITANKRASLDAAIAFSLFSGAQWRRTSEPER